jgi:hypothetical protein
MVKKKEDILSYNFENNQDYVIQKYLDNPLLYNNKKTDLRVYFSFMPIFDDEIEVIGMKLNISNLIIARYAKKDFNKKKYDNKIHLTNLYQYNLDESITEDNRIHFLEVIEYNNDLYNNILNDIVKKLENFFKNLILPELYNYKFYEYFFVMHAMDILIDDNYNLYLIDYNYFPDMTYINLKEDVDKMLKSFILLMYDNYKNILGLDNNDYLQEAVKKINNIETVEIYKK